MEIHHSKHHQAYVNNVNAALEGHADWQGKGLGKRIWRAMVEYCRANGILEIATTVSLRNPPVLNLYAGLGFRFYDPQMTLHWWRGGNIDDA